jgi:beta-lactamase regulating signal transducer with metallopeptidase domain
MSALHVWKILDETGFGAMRFLLAALWQSSILLTAAGLLTWFLRKRRASVRRALWAGALLVGPILPLVAALALRTGAPQAPVRVLPTYAEPVVASLPTEPMPRGFASNPPTVPARPELQVSIMAYQWALLLIAYVAGVSAFLAWIVVGRIRIRRWIKSALPHTDQRVLTTFKTARETTGLTRDFLVLESRCVPSPVSFGILHPVVLLPKGLAPQLSDAELRALAIHELAHVKRQDSLMLSLVALVRAVLFFHPLVWLAARQISVLSE